MDYSDYRNLFKILEIDYYVGLAFEEVKNQRNKLVMKYHPDHNRDKSEAEIAILTEKMAKINYAYNLLTRVYKNDYPNIDEFTDEETEEDKYEVYQERMRRAYREKTENEAKNAQINRKLQDDNSLLFKYLREEINNIYLKFSLYMDDLRDYFKNEDYASSHIKYYQTDAFKDYISIINYLNKEINLDHIKEQVGKYLDKYQKMCQKDCLYQETDILRDINHKYGNNSFINNLIDNHADKNLIIWMISNFYNNNYPQCDEIYIKRTMKYYQDCSMVSESLKKLHNYITEKYNNSKNMLNSIAKHKLHEREFDLEHFVPFFEQEYNIKIMDNIVRDNDLDNRDNSKEITNLRKEITNLYREYFLELTNFKNNNPDNDKIAKIVDDLLAEKYQLYTSLMNLTNDVYRYQEVKDKLVTNKHNFTNNIFDEKQFLKDCLNRKYQSLAPDEKIDKEYNFAIDLMNYNKDVPLDFVIWLITRMGNHTDLDNEIDELSIHCQRKIILSDFKADNNNLEINRDLKLLEAAKKTQDKAMYQSLKNKYFYTSIDDTEDNNKISRYMEYYEDIYQRREKSLDKIALLKENPTISLEEVENIKNMEIENYNYLLNFLKAGAPIRGIEWLMERLYDDREKESLTK